MRVNIKLVTGYQWIWAVFGSIIMWVILGIFAGRLSLDSLITIATSASFLAIPAMGQMLVIATGGGAIDLSIPSVITLSAFLSTGFINGNDANLFVIPLVLTIGGFIGLLNAFLVLHLRIPAIIATLGMGSILTTVILLYNKGFRTFKISSTLLHLSRDRLFGFFPVIILMVLILVVLLTFMFKYTKFGKSLLAIGQNLNAAKLCGINVNLIREIAFVLCGILASFGGIMISARVGGAFLGLGDPYLLQSVASVVVGGTLISGGNAVPIGTFFGSLFLTILATVTQVAGMKIGGQYIINGLLIVFVLFVAANQERE